MTVFIQGNSIVSSTESTDDLTFWHKNSDASGIYQMSQGENGASQIFETEV